MLNVHLKKKRKWWKKKTNLTSKIVCWHLCCFNCLILCLRCDICSLKTKEWFCDRIVLHVLVFYKSLFSLCDVGVSVTQMYSHFHSELSTLISLRCFHYNQIQALMNVFTRNKNRWQNATKSQFLRWVQVVWVSFPSPRLVANPTKTKDLRG